MALPSAFDLAGFTNGGIVNSAISNGSYGGGFDLGPGSTAYTGQDFSQYLPATFGAPAAQSGGGIFGMGGGGGLSGLNVISGALGTIGNLWNAFQAQKLAKQQFSFTKDFANRNLANQIQSYNTALSDRARARGFTEGQSQDQINAYITANQLENKKVG
ncbi:putative structural protein [Rhizobium phage RHph_N38]|uniref:Putative structural protein n=1 Tax=Rhizobium phage RHph_N38 TaxID=2509750 RepID=A0A7S5R3Q3_9CAUD|nr:putative structural protein [Rhizobium phage RHph_N38]QIG70537.1 putative structural protein [Rhizobium phage RHph_N38]